MMSPQIQLDRATCTSRFRIQRPLYSTNRYRRNVAIVQAARSISFEGLSTMNEVYNALAVKSLEDATLHPPGTRHIIGVAGPPGGGKSTLAQMVCRRINQLAGSQVAVQVPMDGYHYYKATLDKMPDPAEAYKRRGAHWTFDAAAYVDCLRQLKTVASFKAPSFNHGIGDPKANDIKIQKHHKIVVSEGNYLLLDLEPWSQLLIDDILDDSWYIDCDIDEAMRRIYKRQTSNGLAPEISKTRIATNDRPNAEEILATRNRARLTVPSLPLNYRS